MVELKENLLLPSASFSSSFSSFNVLQVVTLCQKLVILDFKLIVGGLSDHGIFFI